MTDPTGDTSRRNFISTKTIVLSASLGALAILVTLLYFFPYQTGCGLGLLVYLGYLLANMSPPVKKTTSHTITIKRG